jgi:DNA-binding CsgD family transcriptional regulator
LVDESLAGVAETVDAHTTACLAGLFSWLENLDDARAAALFEVGLAPLRGAATAGPTAWWGVWALLRTIDGRDGGAALAEVRDSNVIVLAVNEAAVAYGDALLAARADDRTGAAEALARGDAATAGMPYARHLLRSVLARAAAAVELGDPAGWVREALAFVEPRGDQRLARACREVLRELGVPVPRQRHGAAEVPPRLRALGVTGREYEVLLLLAQRLTNPEVAERLYLSPRTVETHVSNLLAKTGAASRSDLAGLLAL